jgi:hypothetical protein
MTAPRFSAPVYALFIVVGAIAAGPTCARANDFAMPFGGKAASQPAAAAFAANADESGSAHVSAVSLAPSFAHHDGSGLGGTIACLPSPRAVGIGEHDDQGGWRPRDDDGDDDGHKTPVPEPPSALLVFSGMAALVGWTVRRRRQEITPTNLA